ncbi:MAG: CotH kinase family protein [Bacteroidota bacterium]|nr:CotH kinase family protein [Bacteroidota bacterium]
MGIISNPHGRNHVDDPCTEFDGSIDIELRGNTSLSFDQKQYLLETLDEEGDEDNVSLLGLPKEHDWILFAPYVDKSLMRDVLAYHTARSMGWYASRCRYCELVLDGEYQGVYVLLEQIKRDDDRVDIARLEKETTDGDPLTGGYIVAIDHNGKANDLGFPGAEDSLGYFVYWHIYPKSKNININQRWYMQDLIKEFEAVMRSEDFADPEQGYPHYLNVDSFVDYLIVNEWTNNVDGFVASQYLHKNRDSIDGKLVAGPIWDFNLSFGNADYNDAERTSGWRSHYGRIPFWWRRLLEDSVFVDRVEQRWVELRGGVLSDQAVSMVIDSLVVLLNNPQQRHFEKWELLGIKIWPNFFVGQTWHEEVSYLREWIQDRSAWMDDNIASIAWSGTSGGTGTGVGEVLPDRVRLDLYPMPVRDEVNVSFGPSVNRQGAVLLHDMLGREVFRQEVAAGTRGEQSITLSLGHLPRGKYFLTLTEGVTVIARSTVVLEE